MGRSLSQESHGERKGPPQRGTGGMKRRNSSKFEGGKGSYEIGDRLPQWLKWLNKDTGTKTRPSKSCSIVTLP